MSRFRYILRAATIGATALLLGASLSAAGEYWHPSVTPEQAAGEGSRIATRHAAPSGIARMRSRTAYALMARSSTAKTKDHALILQVNTNDPAAKPWWDKFWTVPIRKRDREMFA